MINVAVNLQTYISLLYYIHTVHYLQLVDFFKILTNNKITAERHYRQTEQQYTILKYFLQRT